MTPPLVRCIFSYYRPEDRQAFAAQLRQAAPLGPGPISLRVPAEIWQDKSDRLPLRDAVGLGQALPDGLAPTWHGVSLDRHHRRLYGKRGPDIPRIERHHVVAFAHMQRAGFVQGEHYRPKHHNQTVVDIMVHAVKDGVGRNVGTPRVAACARLYGEASHAIMVTFNDAAQAVGQCVLVVRQPDRAKVIRLATVRGALGHKPFSASNGGRFVAVANKTFDAPHLWRITAQGRRGHRGIVAALTSHGGCMIADALRSDLFDGAAWPQVQASNLSPHSFAQDSLYVAWRAVPTLAVIAAYQIGLSLCTRAAAMAMWPSLRATSPEGA